MNAKVEMTSGINPDGTAFIGHRRRNSDGSPIKIPEDSVCIILSKNPKPVYLFIKVPTKDEIKEMAKETGVSENSIRKNIMRGRRLTKKLLKEGNHNT